MTKTDELMELIKDMRVDNGLLTNETDLYNPNTTYVEINGYLHVITIEAQEETGTFRLELRHKRTQNESSLRIVKTIGAVRTFIRTNGAYI